MHNISTWSDAVCNAMGELDANSLSQQNGGVHDMKESGLTACDRF